MIGRLHGGALAMAIESSAVLHKHADTHPDSFIESNDNVARVEENKQPSATTTATTATTTATATVSNNALGSSGQPQGQQRGQGLASISCIEIQYLSAMKVDVATELNQLYPSQPLTKQFSIFLPFL